MLCLPGKHIVQVDILIGKMSKRLIQKYISTQGLKLNDDHFAFSIAFYISRLSLDTGSPIFFVINMSGKLAIILQFETIM